eukprot:5923032-Amphidinium_carterae.1
MSPPGWTAAREEPASSVSNGNKGSVSSTCSVGCQRDLAGRQCMQAEQIANEVSNAPTPRSTKGQSHLIAPPSPQNLPPFTAVIGDAKSELALLGMINTCFDRQSVTSLFVNTLVETPHAAGAIGHVFCSIGTKEKEVALQNMSVISCTEHTFHPWMSRLKAAAL